MLPSLSPLSGGSTGSVQVPPPPRFRPIEGKIYGVAIGDVREYADEALSAAQRAGLRYEKKVHEHLRGLWPSGYSQSPVLSFYDGSGKRFCIPDGVLWGKAATVVFEIKYQHMPEAWWQLDQLYRPVLEALRGPVFTVEICRSFDPATPFPCETLLIDDLAEWVRNPRPVFGVYRWK